MAINASLRIGIIGAGRLGSSLAAALLDAGYTVAAVSNRDTAEAHRTREALGGRAPATSSAQDVADRADLVFIAVPDGAATPVAESVVWRKGQWVVHCSGALGLDALYPARRAGARVGCFHPLQSFPSREPEPARFHGIVCGIEGEPELAAFLMEIGGNLGARHVSLEGVDRARYHAAAVLVSNHVVALAAAGARLWAAAGLPPEDARDALSPLMSAAAANVAAAPALAQALTGPVARGDAATVERHLHALADDRELRELYRRLSLELLALPLGHDAETLARLRALLGPSA